jgi:hypothetical protein
MQSASAPAEEAVAAFRVVAQRIQTIEWQRLARPSKAPRGDGARQRLQKKRRPTGDAGRRSGVGGAEGIRT